MLERYDLERETVVIDALRGIAALLVFFSHADAYYLIRFEPFVPYNGYLGAVGVCVFFILSGYLIWSSAARSLVQPNGLKAYTVYRAARIMPLYYVALVFAFGVFPHISSYHAIVSADTIIRHITFTQAFLPDVSESVNPVLWSLTYEMIFYIAVPVLYRFRRYFVFMLIVSVITFVLGHIFPSPYFKFFNLLPLFMFGMWLADYKITPTWRMALVSICAAIVLGFIGSRAYLISTLWAIGILAAVISLRGYRSSLVFKAFAWVGVCSYSLYIWHYMLIQIVGPLLMNHDNFPLRHEILTAIGFTVFCLAISWASYRLIEKPGQVAIKGRFFRSSQPQPAI